MDSLNEEFFKTDWIHILLLQNIFLIHMGLTSKSRIRETMQEFKKQNFEKQGQRDGNSIESSESKEQKTTFFYECYDLPHAAFLSK